MEDRRFDAGPLLAAMRQKWNNLVERGITLYPPRCRRESTCLEAVQRFEKAEIENSETNREEAQLPAMTLCGRIRSKRVHGKASFGHIEDSSGRIQIYLRQDVVGKDSYKLFKKLDVGDFIQITGTAMRTRTGEITLNVTEFTILSKALRPLPEKWHGLQDKEIRYRKRYLDLIANPEIKAAFIKRALALDTARNFLRNRGFIEVETPMLQACPGGAIARPFKTFHNALGIDMFLRIAPELCLKELIIGGMEKVFEVGKVFRNEGISTVHNPEFTIIEAYQAYADYNDMMNLTESLVVDIVNAINDGQLACEFEGTIIDFTPPFTRIKLMDSLREIAGLEVHLHDTEEDIRQKMVDAGLPLPEVVNKGTLLDMAFKKGVEPRLIQPTFVVDYPVSLSPLAKRSPDQPELTERFELFSGGFEYANAYSELNDPVDQRQRFEEQARFRAGGDEEAHIMDEEYVEAMEYGMPPTGGMGLGIERLLMIVLGYPSIRDVILFPALRPEIANRSRLD